MRAVTHDRYGPLHGLRVADIRKPVPGDDQVLIRVHAAGLHVGDGFAVRGTPLLVRVATGILRPRLGVPGFDVAGRVEAVGSRVERFKPGDEVFGTCEGACAEYACASADTLALKPARLTFEQAAALPTSALAALHALRDTGRLRAGQHVLVIGASGGVGSFAVQIARWLGAEVTGVCGSSNVDKVRALGAHHVIDYGREDFSRGDTRYDLILDNVENRSLSDCRRVLAAEGTYIANSGTGARGFALLLRLVKPLVLSPFVRQDLRRYLSVPGHADLALLARLAESGVIEPLIDRVCALHETAAALAHIETGHASGKVVIAVQ